LAARLTRQHADVLVAGLDSPNRSFRVLAARTLAPWDARAVPALLDCLAFKHPGFLSALVASPYSKECRSSLDSFLASTEPAAARARALANRDWLERGLGGTDLELRLRAARALALAGDVSVLPALVELGDFNGTAQGWRVSFRSAPAASAHPPR
jgi:hypothetical protein